MNKSLLSNVVIFAVGAAIGSFVTVKYVENKYRQMAEEEIESVKEHYIKKLEEKITVAKSEYSDKPDLSEYTSMLQEQEYVGEEEESYLDDESYDNYDHIHVISPDDYCEVEEYDDESLNYFADGVLSDEYGNIIEDVENTVGLGFYKHFGEYENDSVHIRNDDTEMYYEILRDERNYTEVFGPYAVED